MEISNELLMAYANNDVTQEERLAVRQYLTRNSDELESVLDMMDEDTDFTINDNPDCLSMCECMSASIDNDDFTDRLDTLIDDLGIERTAGEHDVLPMTAMAAENKMNSLCVIRCEGEALRRFGFDVNDDELIEESQSNGWLQDEGTALHNIGRLAGARGLAISHRYNCSLNDIKTELSKGRFVIAVVDSGELTGDLEQEYLEDEIMGFFPDHAVIVTEVTTETVSIQDSSTTQQTDTYPIAQFENAWADSSNNLIVISNDNDYTPHPINLSDIALPHSFLDLCEVIAENTHEAWAENMMKDGWTYGAERDDAQKKHPCMTSYNRLPESVKALDRKIAVNTVSLLCKLGLIS